MTHGFLYCCTPPRRARLHTLNRPRTAQRQPIQFHDVRNPASLRDDSVPVLGERPNVLIARHVPLTSFVFRSVARDPVPFWFDDLIKLTFRRILLARRIEPARPFEFTARNTYIGACALLAASRAFRMVSSILSSYRFPRC
jgi:hypothetical protein